MAKSLFIFILMSANLYAAPVCRIALSSTDEEMTQLLEAPKDGLTISGTTTSYTQGPRTAYLDTTLMMQGIDKYTLKLALSGDLPARFRLYPARAEFTQADNVETVEVLISPNTPNRVEFTVEGHEGVFAVDCTEAPSNL